jgi:hypothetical protein
MCNCKSIQNVNLCLANVNTSLKAMLYVLFIGRVIVTLSASYSGINIFDAYFYFYLQFVFFFYIFVTIYLH